MVYLELCPFCGKKPSYDENTRLVHCVTLNCAISDFYIDLGEWNYRYNKKGFLLK
jgi:hypothetical protein